MGDACSVEAASKPQQTIIPARTTVPKTCRRARRKSDLGLSKGEIDDEYDVGTYLSHKVRNVKNKITGAVCAAYELKRARVPCEDADELNRSIKTLQALEHPSIVRLFEAFDTPKNVYLIYQLAIGLPLFAYTSKNGFSEPKAANFIQQVASALSYADECGVRHGALLPKNIFVDSQGRVALTDFGLAYVFKPCPLQEACEEDFNYFPPEALETWLSDAKHNLDRWGRYQQRTGPMSLDAEKKDVARRRWWAHASDIWSLGTILFVLITGSTPFSSPDKDSFATAQNIVSCKLDLSPVRASVLGNNGEMVNLLSSMLQKDPSMRPSATEILQHDNWLLRNLDLSKQPVLNKEVCEELKTLHAETHFKKLMMRMILMKMPLSKVRELTDTFAAMDINHDGFVTCLELKRAFAKFPHLLEGDVHIDNVFSAIDCDNSGKIALTEFLAATLDAHHVVTQGVAWEAFKGLDGDGNRRLSKDEMANAVREIDGQLGSCHIADMVKKINAEVGKDSLTFSHFLSLVSEEGMGKARQSLGTTAGGRSTWCPCTTVQRVSPSRVSPRLDEFAPELLGKPPATPTAEAQAFQIQDVRPTTPMAPKQIPKRAAENIGIVSGVPVPAATQPRPKCSPRRKSDPGPTLPCGKASPRRKSDPGPTEPRGSAEHTSNVAVGKAPSPRRRRASSPAMQQADVAGGMPAKAN